jgi:hypothetical protein
MERQPIHQAQARQASRCSAHCTQESAPAQSAFAADSDPNASLVLPVHRLSAILNRPGVRKSLLLALDCGLLTEDYFFVKNSVEFTRLQKMSSSASLRLPTFFR